MRTERKCLIKNDRNGENKVINASQGRKDDDQSKSVKTGR